MEWIRFDLIVTETQCRPDPLVQFPGQTVRAKPDRPEKCKGADGPMRRYWLTGQNKNHRRPIEGPM